MIPDKSIFFVLTKRLCFSLIINKSVLPIISCKLVFPILESSFLTESDTFSKYFDTFSALPLNLFSTFSSVVAIPTGQVFKWHCLAITQPNAISADVPKSNSSAPNIAAKIISSAVFIPPSTLRVTYSLKPLA